MRKDRYGRVIEDISSTDSQAAHNLALSIDERLQALVYRELNNAVAFNKAESGSAVLVDVNTGEVGFSVEKGGIRYGLSAIKSIGRLLIELLKERQENGPFQSIKDFVERMTGKDLNKRVIENFIKAGALDGLGATRRQLMMIYVSLMDQVAQERKNSLSGSDESL